MNVIAKKLGISQFSPIFANNWPILVGLLAMYLPTYLHLTETIWHLEEQAHGPLIFFVCLYLVWINKQDLLTEKIEKPLPITGSVVFLMGILMYVIGRSQEIFFFDVGSQIPIIIGIILFTKGSQTLRTFWFPIFFLIFMIPLPGPIVDALTLPMKIAVSFVAETILYNLDFPIARSGVVLQIGQYQLLVADACAGLHTLFSLEALGLLYLNIVKHDSFLRNLFLGILIVPISFTANVIRVMVLVLVTYFFGNATGQGFIHGFAGMVLFVVALSLIIGVDSLLQYIVKRRATHGN